MKDNEKDVQKELIRNAVITVVLILLATCLGGAIATGDWRLGGMGAILAGIGRFILGLDRNTQKKSDAGKRSKELTDRVEQDRRATAESIERLQGRNQKLGEAVDDLNRTIEKGEQLIQRYEDRNAERNRIVRQGESINDVFNRVLEERSRSGEEQSKANDS